MNPQATFPELTKDVGLVLKAIGLVLNIAIYINLFFHQWSCTSDWPLFAKDICIALGKVSDFRKVESPQTSNHPQELIVQESNDQN